MTGYRYQIDRYVIVWTHPNVHIGIHGEGTLYSRLRVVTKIKGEFY